MLSALGVGVVLLGGYVDTTEGTEGVLSLWPSWPRHMHTKLEKCFAIFVFG